MRTAIKFILSFFQKHRRPVPPGWGFQISADQSPQKAGQPVIPLKEVALRYFESNPEAKSDLMEKANSSDAGFRDAMRSSHRYEFVNGQSRCWVCGESWSSAQVDPCPGFASRHPRKDESPQGVLLREEQLYNETLQRGRSLILARFPGPSDVTGAALAELYHTHGIDPSVVEEVLDCRIPESVHTEFMELMGKERERSRAAQKKEIVAVHGISG